MRKLLEELKHIETDYYNLNAEKAFKPYYWLRGDVFRRLVKVVEAEVNNGDYPVSEEYISKWIKIRAFYKCVKCNHQQMEQTNYCPYCGAKMKEIDYEFN